MFSHSVSAPHAELLRHTPLECRDLMKSGTSLVFNTDHTDPSAPFGSTPMCRCFIAIEETIFTFLFFTFVKSEIIKNVPFVDLKGLFSVSAGTFERFIKLV